MAGVVVGSRRRTVVAAAAIVLVALCVVAAEGSQHAVRTLPGGTRILHVPMSWCIVKGTPAAAAPNVTSEGTTVADTTTNAVMWRRHERPTDNVFLPQASVSLRSSINNSWGALSFPLIDDPDTAVGQPGDVVATDTRTTELMTLASACEGAYAALGRAGIGITAINVGLWRNPNGSYGGQTGLGGCRYPLPAGNPCTSDFHVFVADNRWFYPTVPNRNIAGFGIPTADPLDLIVAHEVGHALNLQHRNNSTQLMNPSTVDNNGDQRVDNTTLTASDVTTLRATAENVPGLEVDPPGRFVPGRLLAMRRIDGRREQGMPGHLDLAALTLTLDTKANRIGIDQRLWGLLPCGSLAPTEYHYLADLDNRPATGASPAALAGLGLGAAFRGAELVARVTIARAGRTCRSRGEAWIVADGRIVPLPSSAFVARIYAMRVYVPHFPVNNRPRPRPEAVDILNTIELAVRNTSLPVRVRQKVPVRLFARSSTERERGDRFGPSDNGVRFILEHPRFPHCFPAGPVAAGQRVAVRFDGLRPNRAIHALLGPIEVLRGVRTNANGGGRIRLPVPRATRRGNHLVTIGHDRLALTADCTVTVR